MRLTKLKLLKTLEMESEDENYDKEDRCRFRRIKKLIKPVPLKVIKSYEYYRGFCYATKIKYLNDIEYQILLAVMENIKENYYA